MSKSSSNKLCHFAEFDESVDFVYSADQSGYFSAAHFSSFHSFFDCVYCVDCVDHVACQDELYLYACIY